MTAQTPQEGEPYLYRAASEAVNVEVLDEMEVFLFGQRHLAELVSVEVPTIDYQLGEVSASRVLSQVASLRRTWRARRESSLEVWPENQFSGMRVGGIERP